MHARNLEPRVKACFFKGKSFDYTGLAGVLQNESSLFLLLLSFIIRRMVVIGMKIIIPRGYSYPWAEKEATCIQRF